MKLITEVIEEVKYIVEAKENGKKDVYIEGIFLQGDIKNRNGRCYPSQVLQKEVKRYTEEYINKNRAFGELGHPDGPTINLDRVSHMIKELRQEGSNWYGKAKVMDTPMGNIVKNIIAEGGVVGVSSRGIGSLKLTQEGINEVQSDFHLSTAADIVADPSAPQAFVNGVMEGVEFWFQDGRIIAAENSVKEIEKLARNKSLNEENLIKVFEKYISSL